jgi:hypothetical protein
MFPGIGQTKPDIMTAATLTRDTAAFAIRSRSVMNQSPSGNIATLSASRPASDEVRTSCQTGAPSLASIVLNFDVEEHHRIEAATGLAVDARAQANYGQRSRQTTKWILDVLAQPRRDPSSGAVMLFFHPWEFNPDRPRLPLGRLNRFRTYVDIRRNRVRSCGLLSNPLFLRALDLARILEGRRAQLAPVRL